MEKIIKIGNKEVKLNNNVGWVYIYRNQFDHDILPTIMPIISTVIDLFVGMVEETGKTENIELRDVVQIAQSDKITDAFIHLSGLELIELVNITWSLAKCGDDSIPEPSRWVRQFDTFPMDEVAVEVGKLVFKGMISSKNLERLHQIKKTMGPLTSTQSSSQG